MRRGTTSGLASAYREINVGRSDDPMPSRAHGTDESVGINSLISGTEIMLALAIDLLAAK